MYREKVIKGLEMCLADEYCNGCPYEEDCFDPDSDNPWGSGVMRDALELLKEQEAKTPIHVHEEYPEHDWETDEDGNINEFAMEYEFHNGPSCNRCGYSFCMHCKPNGWNERPCVIDYYQCPKCGRRISKGIEFCCDCGQAVKWE